MDTPAAPDRFDRIATAIEHLVEEGDELLVIRTEEGVVVHDRVSGALENDHPRLYGRLLSLNAQMEVGMLPTVIGLLLIVLFWLGLETAWFEPVISAAAAERLNVWWVYVLLAFFVILVAARLTRLYARRVYLRSRDELIPLLREADLDRDVLLVRIKGAEELEHVAQQLMLDPKPLP